MPSTPVVAAPEQTIVHEDITTIAQKIGASYSADFYRTATPYQLITLLRQAYPDCVITSTDELDEKLLAALDKAYKAVGYSSLNTYLRENGFEVNETKAPVTPITTGTQTQNVSNAQQSQPQTPITDRRLSNIEDRRAKLDAFTLELQKRYPKGSTLPTTIWELRRDNEDLPVDTAGSWAKIVYQTTLAIYLREHHLLGDNPIATRRQISRESNSGQTVSTSGTTTSPFSAKEQRDIQDRERLDNVIAELKKRYPDMVSESALVNLKRNNPDLNIGSLTGAIKRVSGLTPTEYFKKQRFVVPVNIYELGLCYDLQWSLCQSGVYYIADLMKLTPESISRIPNLNQFGQIQVRNLQEKCRIIYDVDIEDIGLSKRVLTVLQNNHIVTALEIIGGGANYSGIGSEFREEILRCISDYIRNYYRTRCGNVRLDEIGISNRVLSALSCHGIVYMYEAMDGCIELSGIGVVRAREILNCIDRYLKDHPVVEEAEEKEPIEIAPAIDDETAKAEAREKLDQLITELKTRYPEDAEKEAVMFFLRKNNSDLPIAEADNWCRLAFEKPLNDYLQEKALLSAPMKTQHVQLVDAEQSILLVIQPPKEPEFVMEVTSANENVTVEEPEAVEELVKAVVESETDEKGLASEPIQEEKIQEPVGNNFTPEEIVVFSDDELQDLAKKHSERFAVFAAEHQMTYSLEHFNEFFRALYVRQENRYLKNDHNQSYGDYLIRNGIIPHKSAAFWKGALLDFLKKKIHLL